MPREPRRELTWLHDVIYSAERIGLYPQGHTQRSYAADSLTCDGVERRFTIIAEALNRLKRARPDLHGQIRETGQIAAFRNFVVHVDEAVDPQVVGDIAHNNLPLLVAEVQALIQQLEREAEETS